MIQKKLLIESFGVFYCATEEFWQNIRRNVGMNFLKFLGVSRDADLLFKIIYLETSYPEKVKNSLLKMLVLFYPFLQFLGEKWSYQFMQESQRSRAISEV